MSLPEDAKTPEQALVELAKACESRLIMRDGEIPYLWRTYLAGVDSNDCNAFLHRFVSSDAVGELHCHPWQWSMSFILSGAYRELAARGSFTEGPDGGAAAVLESERRLTYRAGSTNLILASTFHRVELLTPEVWTLFIHGPRTNQWGFVEEGKYGVLLPMRVIKERTFDVAPKSEPSK